MAYSVNYTKQNVNVPPSIIPQGECNARVKVQYDEFSHTAAPSTNDEVEFLPLPQGARILNAIVSHGSLGAAGLVALGWKDGSLRNSQGNLVNPADDDGFVVAGATKNTALVKEMNATAGTAGQFKKFDEAITPVLKFTEGPTAASATYKVAIFYTID